MRAVETVDDILASGGDVEVEELIQTDDFDLATLGETQLDIDDPSPVAALGVLSILVLNPLTRSLCPSSAPRSRPGRRGQLRKAAEQRGQRGSDHNLRCRPAATPKPS